VRQRLSTVATFIDWLLDTGAIGHNPLPVSVRRQVTHSYPKTYGKKQDRHPARWLTHDEAYHQLIGACHDGTAAGRRDELFIRLGLLGLRLAEILGTTWADYDPRTGTITRTGKKNRVRTVTAGRTLRSLLETWHDEYQRQLGRPIQPADPILIANAKWRSHHHNATTQLNWTRPLAKRTAQTLLIQRAQTADLGHVAPHDLRRTAAGILHHTCSPDGGHVFDLLDIQQVLDHADPATTQRSYLDQLDTADVKARAGDVLD
jgi:integrase